MKSIKTTSAAIISAVAIYKHKTDLLIIRITSLKTFAAIEAMLISMTN